MNYNHVWRIFACAWLGTALAIIACIYITHSAWCLWALLFPACLSTSSQKTNEENKTDIKTDIISKSE